MRLFSQFWIVVNFTSIMDWCVCFKWSPRRYFLDSSLFEISSSSDGMFYFIFCSTVSFNFSILLSKLLSAGGVSHNFTVFTQASVLVLVFFSMSVSQPLSYQISLRKRESSEVMTMRQALGIPESRLIIQTTTASAIDLNQPLDKLLENKRFRHSFMVFADRSPFFSFLFFKKLSHFLYLFFCSLKCRKRLSSFCVSFMSSPPFS